MLAAKPYQYTTEEQSMTVEEFLQFTGVLAERLRSTGKELVRFELSWNNNRMKIQTLTKELEEIPPVVVDIPSEVPTDH